MATTFYDALNAANLNALRMLDTLLKALDDNNPVPSFLNTVNERIRMQQALNAGKERQDYYNQLKSGLYGKKGTQQPPQYNLGEGVGFNENGQYKVPAQLTFNPYGVDLSGLGGNEGNTISVSALNGVQNILAPKQNSWGSLFNQSFNQPPTDNPLAQAVEGQGTSPNYMSLMSNGLITPQQQLAFDEKMNLRRWIEWDALNNGVTNPLVALQRYLMFMEPMRQQAELDELRNAYYIMNSDPNDKRFTPEQRMNARTLVEFDKKNPYYVDDHDMNVERFNWAKQNFNNQQALFPYQLERAQLGTLLQRQQLDANELANTGEYAGVNLEGDSWYRKNDGVDLSNLQGRALAGLNHASVIFKSMFGEPLMVTSGRDSDAHMGGQYSHYTGWKVDVSSGMDSKKLEDPQERAKFIQALGSVGIIVNDEWAKDKHLDLNFQNYHGNYTKNRNRNLNKNSLSNKSSKNTFDLHESLNGLSDIEGKYDANADDATQKNYQKEYDKAYGNVKSSIQKEYPNLKQSVEQLKSKGYTTKQIGIMLAEDIYNNNNTKIGFEPLADIVSEIITSSNYGDPSYNSKELSSEIKQELEKTLERTKTLRNRSKRRPNSYDSIFGGYFNTSNAGLTDRDILDRQGSEKKDATRRILSEAERVGNIKYDDDKKFKEANKTEIERLYDEVEAHKKGKK